MVEAATRTASPMDERQYTMLLHLSALAGFLIGGLFFLGPLIMWLIKKDSPFVDHHGRSAMNFHLSLIIYAFAAGLLFALVAIVTLGIGVLLLIPFLFIALIAVTVLLILFPILAAVQANKGQPYRYPLAIPLLGRQ